VAISSFRQLSVIIFINNSVFIFIVLNKCRGKEVMGACDQQYLSLPKYFLNSNIIHINAGQKQTS
jgi:hypothetical protein